ncbi:MAG: SpvB/TcaC N-terminal domain-containing protein [Dokdonella sp.]
MNIQKQSQRTGFTTFNVSIMAAAIALTVLGGGWAPLAISGADPETPVQPNADTPLAHDPTAGTVAGEPGVEGGASTYRIPIAVPPGRAGLQPDVALVYNSRGGNGIAGMGWSLSTSSAIQRCPQTLEQDGRARGVAYDADDRLCLDGRRLIRVGGSGYGQSGAEYRTEIDTFARITQIGGSLTGSGTCFKVEQKSGRVLHLGAVSSGSTCFASVRNARVQPAGAAATLTWLVEKEEDRVGNNVFFSYSSFGNGEVLPWRMEYTGFGTGIGDRRVEMVYGPRSATASAFTYDADIASSYLAGGATMQTQRLLRIDTYESPSSKVSSWKFDYQATSRQTGRSLLRSVNQCALNNGSETCLAIPTRFDWEDSFPQFAFKQLTLPGLPQSVWNLSDATIGQEVLEDMQEEQILALRESGVPEPADGFTPADLPVPDLVGTPLGAVLVWCPICNFT